MNTIVFLCFVALASAGDVGSVLSKRNVYLQEKHRRSLANIENVNHRHRRSHMPYLGQNLDALGIVRAQPNWEKPAKKTIPRNADNINEQQSLIPPPLAAVNFANSQPPIKTPTQLAAEEFIQQQQQQQAAQAYYRALIPGINRPLYAPVSTAKQVLIPQMRSYLPAYNPYMSLNSMQFQPRPYGKLLEQSAHVENTDKLKQSELPGVERKKKSASPEPDVATLNYAARHRNVYMDSVSGDPYSGGSSVMNRQNTFFKKH